MQQLSFKSVKLIIFPFLSHISSKDYENLLVLYSVLAPNEMFVFYSPAIINWKLLSILQSGHFFYYLIIFFRLNDESISIMKIMVAAAGRF